MEIQEILEKSSFRHIAGIFVYAKARTVPVAEHFMVTKDADEITVLTTEDRLGELELIERNKDSYALLELNVSVPFYAVGFLAAVTGAISAGGMNVLVVSTYSKDYILVRVEHTEKAIEALKVLGLSSL